MAKSPTTGSLEITTRLTNVDLVIEFEDHSLLHRPPTFSLPHKNLAILPSIHMLILAALSLSQLVYSQTNCLSIESTSACAPWSAGLKIDASKLSEIYGADIKDAGSWDTLVLQTTSGGDAQTQMWKNWAGCDAYTGTLLQYDRSYVCLTDLFHYSKECNKDVKVTPLCPDVCDEYIGAARLLLESEDCATLDHYPERVKNEYLERRKHVMNGIKGCRNLASGSYFNNVTCIPGIKDDESSCGFGGNVTVAKSYCAAYPETACCIQIQAPAIPAATNPSEPEDGFITRIKNFFKLSDTDDATPSFYHRSMMALAVDTQPSTTSSSGSSIMGTFSIFWIGIISIGVLLLPIVVYMVYHHFQHRKRKPSTPSAPKQYLTDDTYRSSTPFSENVKHIVSGQILVASFPYSAKNQDELSFKSGDKVVFLSDLLIDGTSNPDAGWIQVQSSDSGAIGMVHSSYFVGAE